MHIRNRQLRIAGLSALAILALSSGQMQATAVSTPTLGVFSEESVVSMDKLDVATLANLAPGVYAAIRAGALEIRQSVSYDPGHMMLQVTGFVVASGSPLPTASSAQPLNVIWSYSAQVTEVRLTTTSKYSLAFVGRINSGAFTAFGDVGGVSVFISMAYVPAAAGGTVTQFYAIETSIVGNSGLFAASGWGNAQIMPSVAIAPPIAIAGPKGTQTVTGTFRLDGTKSSDPMGGTLSYQWTFVPVGGQTVTLTGADTATPSVSIPQNMFTFGDYLFLLRVFNSTGLTSADTVTVSYPFPEDPPPVGL